MNRIYRRIWSTARRCWVVASELTSPRGKPSSTAAASITACVLLASGGAVFNASGAIFNESCDPFIADYYQCTPSWGHDDARIYTVVGRNARNSLVTGNGTEIDGAYSTLFGHRSRTFGDMNAVFGYNALASKGYSTAVGAYSRAEGVGTIALGNDSRAYSENSISVGSGARTSDSSAGVSRIAIGGNAYAGSAGYTGAIALGGNARAEYDALALGHGAKATAIGAVALGRNSQATESNSVSVGSASSKRRIVNVGDARLSASSTDAVTGKQLHATNLNVTAATTTANAARTTANTAKTTADAALAKANLSSDLIGQTAANGSVLLGAGNTGTVLDVKNKNGIKRRIQNIENGAVSAISTDAVTGQQLHATNSRLDANAVALGAGAVAESPSYGISTALGAQAKAYNGQSLALGADARAGVDREGNKAAGINGSVAVGALSRSGNGAVALGQRSSAVGDRGIAVGNDAVANATHATAVGFQSKAGGNQATALGRGAQAYGVFASALGNMAKANAESSVALGDRALSQHAGSVALGSGSQTSAANQVSVGSASVKRQIVNVADGAVGAGSNQAVTGNQLHATNQAVTTARTTADSALAKANTVSGLVGQTAAAGNVRLGAENTGTVLDVRNKNNASRKITGVADATLSSTSTDAVSGRQLTATNSNVTAAQNAATAAQTTATSARTVADSALGKATALEGLVGQTAAAGSVRLGAENTGTVLDVRNKSNASRKITGVADGTLSGTSTDAVSGRQLTATNSNVTAAQNAATAAQTTATAARTVADGALGKATALEGLVGQTSANGNVRLGAQNTGTVLDVANKTGVKRRIYNIANGVLSAGSTDAVTGQQLFATNTLVEGNASQLKGHAQQLLAQDGRIGDNRSDLDKLREEMDNFDPDLEGVVKFSDDRSYVDLEGARLEGVAAGDISSAASTDAVNGGQLFATNERVARIEDQAKYLAVGAGGPGKAVEVGLGAVALGDSAIASPDTEGAVALGSFSLAMGKNSVALGRASQVTSDAEGGFALGVRSLVEEVGGVALGSTSSVRQGAVNGVAIGNASIATEADSVSFGHASYKRRLVNVAQGTSSTDVVVVSQFEQALAALGGGAGIDSSGDVISPAYQIQGTVHSTVGDALTALDGAVIRSDARIENVEDKYRALFQESSGSLANGSNQLAFAGANGMVLTNVANGRIAAGSRDAVNGDQLHAAQEQIDRNRSDLDLLRDERGPAASASAPNQSGAIDFGGARLTGLSAGDISSIESSDAVNGGQLFATNARVAKIEDTGRFISIGRDGQSTAAQSSLFGVAIGDSSVASPTAEGGTAVGAFANAGAVNSVALGRAAFVEAWADRGFAQGVGARVSEADGIAIGAYSKVLAGASYSVAIGTYSVATEDYVVSFGYDNIKRRLVNVANGRSATDAATVGQLRGAFAALGGDVDTNGNIIGPRFNVQGGTQSTLDAALQSLDGAVTINASRVNTVEHQLRSVFQNTPSIRSDGLPQLNLAGANGMVLGNVANGMIAAGSRDAVNGGQLHAMQQRLDGRIDGIEQRIDDQPQAQGRRMASADAPTESTAPVTPDEQGSKASGTPTPASAGDSPTGKIASADGGKPAADESPTPQVSTRDLEQMLERANQYTDQATAGIERRLEKMDKRFNRMAAMSSAQSAMAMNTAGLNTYNRLGAGVGYAEGESAMAVGYQRVLNDKGSATFSLNGAFTNSGERSMGVGVGIGW
ncbi:ESPR-type extended signal peptide-containing protein [Stenotrophomonas sp. C2852]|uniref:ESPR-type extended signal peptide-containing protein n=1 Tax=Stenotrophomonas sp. C2852 TaxID=3077845 RepID=UPI00293C547A|nr:ESPR-type extended signal peptide-containing protein [Stenotrophomonas sp. C2852]MDV3436313.1 ESPR-type extended signal peptide-containing protein [Stenotrophomonas sp. C2852]